MKHFKIGIFKSKNLQLEPSECKTQLLQKRSGNESAIPIHYATNHHKETIFATLILINLYLERDQTLKLQGKKILKF